MISTVLHLQVQLKLIKDVGGKKPHTKQIIYLSTLCTYAHIKYKQIFQPLHPTSIYLYYLLKLKVAPSPDI